MRKYLWLLTVYCLFKVSFSAYATITSSTSGQTIVFQHEIIDVGNGYNPSTGIYTVPRTGRYQVSYTLSNSVAASNNLYSLMVNNNSTPASTMWLYEQHDAYYRGSNSVMIPLDAGDKIFMKIQQQSGSSSYLRCNYGGDSQCTFSAFMLN